MQIDIQTGKGVFAVFASTKLALNCKGKITLVSCNIGKYYPRFSYFAIISID